jgi:predicted transcriptional regulator
MEEQELPADVLRFILDRIDSVPHLEALLLLWDSNGRAWTDAEVANRVYVPGDTARGVLERLVQRGLVRAEQAPPPRSGTFFVYNPAWDADGTLMPRVAATYRRQLVKVATVIHAKASSSVEEFAKAFQLKKDP